MKTQREIEFRGKSIAINDWAFGALITHKKPLKIMGVKYTHSIKVFGEEWIVPVYSETIGQYIWINDGKRKIFEDDKVKLIQKNYNANETEYIGKIVFMNGRFMLEVDNVNSLAKYLELKSTSSISVIGNIHQPQESDLPF